MGTWGQGGSPSAGGAEERRVTSARSIEPTVSSLVRRWHQPRGSKQGVRGKGRPSALTTCTPWHLPLEVGPSMSM
eukprot:scaffold29818_cov41-Tisochrysis_lutea.AAC.1